MININDSEVLEGAKKLWGENHFSDEKNFSIVVVFWRGSLMSELSFCDHWMGVHDELIWVWTRLIDALRLRQRCHCYDVASAACGSSSRCGLGCSLPFGCANSLEESWIVLAD